MLKRYILVLLALAALAVSTYFIFGIKGYQAIKKEQAELNVADSIITNPNYFEKSYFHKVRILDTSIHGYILSCPSNPARKCGYLIIMKPNGDIIYEQEKKGIIYDFKQILLGGKIYYSYLFDDSVAYHIKGREFKTGHIVLLDSTLKELKQIHLLPYKDVVLDKHQDLDIHDFIMLSENHFYILATYTKYAKNIPAVIPHSNRVSVSEVVVQEIVDDKVVWQWESTDDPAFYIASANFQNYNDTTTVHDYLHVNALCIAPNDSNLVVSFRQISQVVKVDRRSGKVIWRMGGINSDFAFDGDKKFYWQHDFHFYDGNNILMFDNGDSVLRPKSRILDLKIDEKSRKVTSFYAADIARRYNKQMGSVSKKDGKYLICGGLVNYILGMDSATKAITYEINTCHTFTSYRINSVENIFGLEQKLEQK